MKEMLTGLRLLIVSIFSIILITRQRGYWQGSFAFDTELDIICWGIVGLFSIWPVFQQFLKTGTLDNLSQASKISLGVLVATILAVSGMSINRQQYFNQKSILKIAKGADFNGVSMDFKADGTYIFNSYSIGANYLYGSYTIRENHIHLQPDETTKSPISERLLITAGGNGEKMVVEVDEMGVELERGTRFQVTKDNQLRIGIH